MIANKTNIKHFALNTLISTKRTYNRDNYSLKSRYSVLLEHWSPGVEFSGLKMGIIRYVRMVGEGIVSPLSVSPSPQYS